MAGTMPKNTPETDREALSIAFVLVFTQGRAPPSCPCPDERDLLNRIMDRSRSASPAACRDALIRVRRLSIDLYTVCGAFREGACGKMKSSEEKAIRALKERNPGFNDDEYRTAFEVGMMWTSFVQKGE